VIPRLAGEALWIGLVAPPGGPPSVLRILALLRSGERLNLVSGTAADEPLETSVGKVFVPPRHAVEGIARQDGTWWALAAEAHQAGAPSCTGIELLAWSAPAVARATADRPRHRPQHQERSPFPRRSPSASPHAPERWDLATARPVRVDITDVFGFEALSGEPVAPLDGDAAYRGWPLP